MTRYAAIIPGIILCLGVALAAVLINSIMPVDLLGIALVSLILGMLLNPVISRQQVFHRGVDWTSKLILSCLLYTS